MSENSKICLSIEQMKALADLNVDTSEATFAWIVDTSDVVKPFYTLMSDAKHFMDANSIMISAFGIQDILRLLPFRILPDFYSLYFSEIGSFPCCCIEKRFFTDEEKFEIGKILKEIIDSYLPKDDLMDAAYLVLSRLSEKGFLKKFEERKKMKKQNKGN